jgi:hypothetical protein
VGVTAVRRAGWVELASAGYRARHGPRAHRGSERLAWPSSYTAIPRRPHLASLSAVSRPAPGPGGSRGGLGAGRVDQGRRAPSFVIVRSGARALASIRTCGGLDPRSLQFDGVERHPRQVGSSPVSRHRRRNRLRQGRPDRRTLSAPGGSRRSLPSSHSAGSPKSWLQVFEICATGPTAPSAPPLAPLFRCSGGKPLSARGRPARRAPHSPDRRAMPARARRTGAEPSRRPTVRAMPYSRSSRAASRRRRIRGRRRALPLGFISSCASSGCQYMLRGDGKMLASAKIDAQFARDGWLTTELLAGNCLGGEGWFPTPAVEGGGNAHDDGS